MKQKAEKVLKSRSIGILLVLLCMVIAMSLASDVFLSWQNILSILQQAAIKGVIAVGMTVVIISGSVDLSVGSTVALSALFCAEFMIRFGAGSIWLALLIALLTGAVCGFINGFLISMFNLQPFIVTMGTLNIYRGIQYIISGARIVRGVPAEFTSSMNALNYVFPVPVIILFVVALIVNYILKYTKYGRYVFAVGGNEEASRLSGINVKWIRIINYTVVGITAGICAIILIG